MKILGLVISVLLMNGCTIIPRMRAVDDIADRKIIAGLGSNTEFSFSIPAAHTGQYSSVKQLKFIITNGMYKGKSAFAILGNSRKTDQWQVILIRVQTDDQWQTLPQATKS